MTTKRERFIKKQWVHCALSGLSKTHRLLTSASRDSGIVRGCITAIRNHVWKLYKHCLKASLWCSSAAIGRLYNTRTSPVLLLSLSFRIQPLFPVTAFPFPPCACHSRFPSPFHKTEAHFSRSFFRLLLALAHSPAFFQNPVSDHLPLQIVPLDILRFSRVKDQEAYPVSVSSWDLPYVKPRAWQGKGKKKSFKSVQEILHWSGLKSKERCEEKCYDVRRVEDNHTEQEQFISTQWMTFACTHHTLN